MTSYTGKRFVNPLNKNIGRRTGRDFRAGKNIRVGKDGFENFDDYFSESDAELTREYPRKHVSTIREESENVGTQESCSDEEYKENQPSGGNTVSQSMPDATLSNTTCNITSSQSLSQGGQNRSKFGWLRNRDIGRRTGKNITANKQIRVDDQGFENFDDYLSESDVSSISSRLSVSVVKPVPRRSGVSNLVIADMASSVSSQGTQRSSTAASDEGESPEEDVDSQNEQGVDRHNGSRTPESTHSGSEDETFTKENNKCQSRENNSQSVKKQSDLSKSEHTNRTNHSRLHVEEPEAGDRENNFLKNMDIENEMSSHYKSQYVDTPLSSKRSRSHISAVSDKYADSKSSSHNLTGNYVDKSNVSRNSESHSYRHDKSGKHKADIRDNSSQNERKPADKSDVSLEYSKHGKVGSDSEAEDDMENEQSSHDDAKDEQLDSNDEFENNDTGDDDDDVSYVEQVVRNNEEESDDEHLKSKQNEVEEIDDESEENVMEIQKKNRNNKSIKKNKSIAENTGNSSHRELTATDKTAKEEVEMIIDQDEIEAESDEDVGEIKKNISNKKNHKKNKSIDKNTGSIAEREVTFRDKTTEKDVEMTENNRNEEGEERLEKDNGSMSDYDSDEYDDDDLRPSQAQTNIDVAGNRSGSITKLDIPSSVVSFNKTRKRLSYSAIEASEESLQRNKSRIEKANAELFSSGNLSNSKEVKGHLLSKQSKDRTRNTENSKKIKENETAEVSSEFLCLASRSTLPQPVQDTHDEDDDIEIFDYDRPKVTAENGRKKSTNNKTRKQSKKSDTDSQSDNEKQAQSKNVNKGSKSEIKRKKPKENARNRRKTTYGSSKMNKEVEDINLKTDDVNMVIDSEKKSLVESQSDENFKENLNKDDSTDVSNVVRNINDNDDTSDETVSKKGNKTLDQNKRKKGKQQVMSKRNKNNKSQSTVDNEDQLKTNDNTLKPTEHDRCTDDSEEVESVIGKEITEKSSKKTSKRKNSTQVTVSDSSNNDGKKKSTKKLNRKSVVENGVDSENDHVDKSIEDGVINNISLKRKSSSDECFEDNEGMDFKTKKARKTSVKTRSKGKGKNTKQKSSGSFSSDNGEMVESGKVKSELNEDEIVKRTPTVDSRLSVPSHFGSGVSFRVSRRSELLEDVGSGYIGEVTVHAEPTQLCGGLTPCISRPGIARKSKGRRVTICPEENIEHNISGGHSSDENRKSSSHFRWNTEASVNSTPLPGPDSTPVHFAETTHTATPHPGKGEESVIEDRLIKPSPPEQGLRRSQRTRLKPIAWYKNEQVVFDYRRRSGPAIVGVKPSLEVKWNRLEEERRKKRMLKNQIRKASRSEQQEKPYRKLSIHKPLPSDINIEENQDPEITVFNQNLQAEDGIECVGKRDAFKPVGPTYETPKKEDPFIITKLLDHPCMSAGKLHIKPNAEKPEQLVIGDYTLFFIEYGKVLVTLHKTSFLMETGDTFMVPVGNTYSISNLRADTAKLFYTVHKQIDSTYKSSDTPVELT